MLDYESKLSQIKLPLFQVFRGLHEFNFLEVYIYVNIWLEQRYLK